MEYSKLCVHCQSPNPDIAKQQQSVTLRAEKEKYALPYAYPGLTRVPKMVGAYKQAPSQSLDGVLHV